ncbi:MAG TPA: DUF2505 family protein [Acidimicrobiales bacterium]|nr:DUF2505 family protein [Acidimicrobiales bacterium]
MRFEIVQTFAGPLQQVEAALVDPAFLDRLSTMPHLGRPTLVHRVEAGDLVHQWVKYAFTGEVNSAVRRVVDPSRLTWVEESTLDRRTHRTTWRIVPDHYRNLLRSSGEFRLDPDPDRPDTHTRRTTEAELKVTVPLVGGKVERAIVNGLREHAAEEEQVLDDWLAETSN